ncbi:MAG: flagellar biosynthesis protein FlgD [Gammaproteobacteria bacterium]|jgi:flagellar basal-body rod modification protein FlgD|uniref:flagellar hook assembly protein FlgD n=1 Tax=Marinomonas sp. ef1 TaxID=2005043 RepID=UPI000C281722|nr:flagellar hook capping FlgD N-terminal domain-containing protein [Marinomonas sp. ef1]MBU1293719.1 flagellar biosynthesis protein FlgD [Gammaproteobacteria bacterium]MBU1466749.1 flagellar biosynthesis protein FlgD [Gammaproteobacteria bacterium]MBU2024881.1 flagellar biosynthesis protein FlgD [Gammaproteobacteria bacterium]MBU2240586.1 flagellar biosynthesis protein FlgD [Gammaproteobacteria bacterium]MBU2319988.1 flagellar biosynthesis protein FlgD [Gammaproteobacteria bacterium]
MANISDSKGLNGLISQYGTEAAKTKAGIEKPEVQKDEAALADQNVFLKLYIEQLKGQDPTAPQDTNDMVAQMSQFSSLERLTSISDQLENMATSLTSNQALSASTLVGKSILMDGNKVKVTDGLEAVQLRTVIPENSKAATLKIYDADNRLVRTAALNTGEYKWDKLDDDGNVLPPGEYRFAASSTNEQGEISAMSTQLPTRIQGVTINGENGTVLNVENHGKIKLTNELEILG